MVELNGKLFAPTLGLKEESENDRGPSRGHIRPLTRAMTKRMEEEDKAPRTLLLWRMNY